MKIKSRPEVVMITGAATGIGRATAQAFAKRGAHIGLLAHGRVGLEGAKADIEKLGVRGMVLVTDVAGDKAVESTTAKSDSEYGALGRWLNNAIDFVVFDYERFSESKCS